jgi:hypothetical protein
VPPHRPREGDGLKLNLLIPTLLLVGLLLGRWWRVVIPVAAIGWTALLMATGVDSGLAFALGATMLALVNVTIGVLVFQAAWFAWRRVTTQHAGDEVERR